MPITLNLILWLGGTALLVIATWRVRAPFGRMSELDRLAENARRYDSWRGGRSSTAAGSETTGADVMRQLLRRQVAFWSAIGVAGVFMIIAGFAVR